MSHNELAGVVPESMAVEDFDTDFDDFDDGLLRWAISMIAEDTEGS